VTIWQMKRRRCVTEPSHPNSADGSLAGLVDRISAIATDGTKSLINGVKVRLVKHLCLQRCEYWSGRGYIISYDHLYRSLQFHVHS